MGRGKRYSDERQLNYKKVYAVIGVFIFIVMFIIGMNKILKADKNTLATKNIELNYFPVYTNERWGVINSSGDMIVQPEYNEMILNYSKKECEPTIVYTDNFRDDHLCMDLGDLLTYLKSITDDTLVLPFDKNIIGMTLNQDEKNKVIT